MAVKAIIFLNDGLYPELKTLYDEQVRQGNIEIVGQAILENDGKIYPDILGGD